LKTRNEKRFKIRTSYLNIIKEKEDKNISKSNTENMSNNNSIYT